MELYQIYETRRIISTKRMGSVLWLHLKFLSSSIIRVKYCNKNTMSSELDSDGLLNLWMFTSNVDLVIPTEIGKITYMDFTLGTSSRSHKFPLWLDDNPSLVPYANFYIDFLVFQWIAPATSNEPWPIDKEWQRTSTLLFYCRHLHWYLNALALHHDRLQCHYMYHLKSLTTASLALKCLLCS